MDCMLCYPTLLLSFRQQKKNPLLSNESSCKGQKIILLLLLLFYKFTITLIDYEFMIHDFSLKNNNNNNNNNWMVTWLESTGKPNCSSPVTLRIGRRWKRFCPLQCARCGWQKAWGWARGLGRGLRWKAWP